MTLRSRTDVHEEKTKVGKSKDKAACLWHNSSKSSLEIVRVDVDKGGKWVLRLAAEVGSQSFCNFSINNRSRQPGARCGSRHVL